MRPNTLKHLDSKKILIPLIAATICLIFFVYQSLFTHQVALNEEKEKALKELSNYASLYSSIVKQQIDKAQSLALFTPNTSEVELQNYAELLYSQQSQMISGWLVTRSTTVINSDLSNLSLTRKGTNLSDDPIHGSGLKKALSTHRTIITTDHAKQNSESITSTLNCYIPILSYENNLPKDVLGTFIVQLNIDRLMSQSGFLNATRTYQIALIEETSNKIMFNTFNSAVDVLELEAQKEVIDLSMNLNDANWNLYAVPISGWKPQLTEPITLLFSGTSLFVLIFSYLHRLLDTRDKLNLQVNVRTQQLKETNEYLEESLASLEEKQSELEVVNNQLEDSLEALNIAQDQLIRTEKLASLGQLVAGVAHEINTPLGIAITVSSYLKENYHNVNEQFKENQLSRSDFATFLDNSTEAFQSLDLSLLRTADIVSSFKTVAVDQTHLEARLINLNDYLNDLSISLQPRIRDGNHNLSITCPENLEIVTFPGAISHIVTNLIINSIIHGFDGTTEGLITINVTANPPNICIRYTDNGIGIPDDLSERVFDPFFTTKRLKGCTGLGLHIVNNMVSQALHGVLTLEPLNPDNNERRGVVFTVCIPINRDHDHNPA